MDRALFGSILHHQWRSFVRFIQYVVGVFPMNDRTVKTWIDEWFKNGLEKVCPNPEKKTKFKWVDHDYRFNPGVDPIREKDPIQGEFD